MEELEGRLGFTNEEMDAYRSRKRRSDVVVMGDDGKSEACVGYFVSLLMEEGTASSIYVLQGGFKVSFFAL